MEKFIPHLEKVTIKDCGHWTQQEKPEHFNKVIVDWLKRNYPPTKSPQ
jgi:pimeloyl-ACP methyl ester carboxylesterase